MRTQPLTKLRYVNPAVPSGLGIGRWRRPLDLLMYGTEPLEFVIVERVLGHLINEVIQVPSSECVERNAPRQKFIDQHSEVLPGLDHVLEVMSSVQWHEPATCNTIRDLV